MTAGRIEPYIHSDSITSNKGGVLAKVLCQTDFAARTEDFIVFSMKIARLAYAFGFGAASEGATSITWDEFLEAAGEVGTELEAERAVLEAKLKEKITIAEIVILIL